MVKRRWREGVPHVAETRTARLIFNGKRTFVVLSEGIRVILNSVSGEMDWSWERNEGQWMVIARISASWRHGVYDCVQSSCWRDGSMQWSPYKMYKIYLTFKNLAVSLRTTRFKIKKIPHSDYIAFFYFVWISEQTETFAFYCLNWLVFITVVESVYSAVRIESLYDTDTVRL